MKDSATARKKLANALKAIAVDRGETQVSLAAEIGLSQAQVSRVLAGAQNVRSNVLMSLCRALKTKPSTVYAKAGM